MFVSVYCRRTRHAEEYLRPTQNGMLKQMSILFVCRANVIRSQMAAAFYNKLSQSTSAASAGTVVDKPGESLGERSRTRPASALIIKTMKEKGIDLSGSPRTQLTPEMVSRYDKIINMAGPQYTPEWLSKSPHYEFWDVSDPMAKGSELMTKTADSIESKVTLLLQNHI